LGELRRVTHGDLAAVTPLDRVSHLCEDDGLPSQAFGSVCTASLGV